MSTISHSTAREITCRLLKAEALGYKPAISRKLLSNEGAVSIDFELTPSHSMTGIVLTPDGKPAVGAKIIVAVANQMNRIIEGRVRSSDNERGKTNEQGRFEMPQQSGSFQLLVTHDSGVAIIGGNQIEPDEQIQLSSWAKITGTVELNGRPVKDATVSLVDLAGPRFPQPGFSVAGEVAATDEGKFYFDRVVPGKRVMVALAVESGSGTGYRRSYTHGERIETEAGKTYRVVVGGAGQNVIGRMVVPDKAPEFDWGFCQIKRAKPRDFDKWSPVEREQWWEKRRAEDAKDGPIKSYTFAVEDDGSFRVNALPPGEYELKVTVRKKRNLNQRTRAVTLGKTMQRFSVETPINKNKPLDLGPISVNFFDQP